MKSNHNFDKFIRDQINGIDYNGAEQAWEAFSQGVGAEAINYTPKGGDIIWTRRLSLILALVGLTAMYAFFSIDDSAVLIEQEPSKLELHEGFDNETLPVGPQIPETKEIPATPLQASVETKSNADNKVVQNSQEKVKTILSRHNTAILSDQSVALQNETTIPIVTKHSQVAELTDKVIASVSSEKVIEHNQPTVDAITFLPTGVSPNLEHSASLPMDGKFGQILIPLRKKPVRMFSELGLSNQNAGVRLIAGVNVPMGNWSFETGAGFNFKIKEENLFSIKNQAQSDIELASEHDFTFSQLVNFVAPVRIKRHFKKHNFHVGGQIVRNVTNNIQIESSVTKRLTSQEVRVVDFTYLYQNHSTANHVHSYTVAKSTDWNFEASLGYEYQSGKFGLGVILTKPIAPSFRLFSNDQQDLLHTVNLPVNFGINLKYFI